MNSINKIKSIPLMTDINISYFDQNANWWFSSNDNVIINEKISIGEELIFFSRWIEMIPIAALTGIMMMVVIGTFAWASLKILSKVPKEDAIVIILVTSVTVWQDLAIAVIVGVIFSALSYAWKSSTSINIADGEIISKDERVYLLKGSLFFGSINKFKEFMHPSKFDEKIVNLDCSESWIWDQSSIEVLDNITNKFKKNNKILNIINLGPTSHKILKKSDKVFDINIVD